MIKRAAAVVIGGGITGCATAYHLARLGCRPVAVVEKSYLAGGATGRCGAGIRQQWGTTLNCLLARESLRHFSRLEEELDYPGSIELKQGGYLFPAYGAKEWEQLGKNAALQQSLGIPSRLLAAREAREIVPHLSAEGLRGAAFCPTDGHANPFFVTDAYARAAARLGVKFYKYTAVTGLAVSRARIRKVITTAGEIDTPAVLNAAGAHAAQIAAMAGIKLPVRPERHEVLVTEPVNPLQGPMVVSLSRRFYCQQTPHGSFIIGQSNLDEPESFNIASSRRFMPELAGKICRTLPLLGELRVVRQWAGLYDMTPDAHPILDEAAEVQGFFTAAGFSGHGFMIAPAVSRIMAGLMLGLGHDYPVEVTALGAGRFASGALVREPAVV